MTAEDDPDLTAAELALGLLDGTDRAAALRRVLAEPVFAHEVEAWRAHFAQLFDAWPEADTPGTLGTRLEGSLDGASAPRRSAMLWPAIAVVTSAIAACLLLFVVTRPIDTVAPSPVPAKAAPASVLVASIAPVKEGVSLAALYDPDRGTLRINRGIAAKTTQSAELWVIAADGIPHALGLLTPDAGTAITVGTPNRERLAEGSTLAVSIEPVGGSPEALPTGPVIAKGVLQRV